MMQGEIWMVEQPAEKARPHLILTRSRAIPVLHALMAAPLTRTIRNIPTEVELGADDGLAVHCAASLDNVRTVSSANFTRRVGRLAPGRWHEVCAATRAALDC